MNKSLRSVPQCTQPHTPLPPSQHFAESSFTAITTTSLLVYKLLAARDLLSARFMSEVLFQHMNMFYPTFYYTLGSMLRLVVLLGVGRRNLWLSCLQSLANSSFLFLSYSINICCNILKSSLRQQKWVLKASNTDLVFWIHAVFSRSSVELLKHLRF